MSEIPKIIHYIWFGGAEKPEIVLRCIHSWKRYFPDHEIWEWNEDNYEINKNDYVTEAYRCGKWAFVSDYARFDILNRYGGIYFDTDVEVLKKFDEIIFHNNGFTGMESTGDVAPGLVFGCIPAHPFLEKILRDYDKSHFIVAGKQCPITINERVTELMIQDGYQKTGTMQVVDDICIYPSEYFCGFDLDVFEPNITDKTYSIHHYTSSWAYGSFKIKRGFQSLLKRSIGVSRYRKVLKAVRNYREKKNKSKRS